MICIVGPWFYVHILPLLIVYPILRTEPLSYIGHPPGKKTTSPQTSTASQWKTILPSKSLPRHNANPFYIQNSQGNITLRSKMATALQRPPLCNENQNGHRTTPVHSIITSAQWKCYISDLFSARGTFFDHTALQVLHLPREMILYC